MRALILGLVFGVLSSGCGHLSSKDSAALGRLFGMGPDEVTMEEVNKAKAAKDHEALEKLCLDRKRKFQRKPKDTLKESCQAAIAILVENQDVDRLDKICHTRGKYAKWPWARQACKAKATIKANAGAAALKTATCKTLEGIWDKSKRTLTNAYNTTVESRNAAFQGAAFHFIKCGRWDYVWENMVHWGGKKGLGSTLLDAMHNKGIDVEKQMFAYLKRHKSNPFAFEHGGFALAHYVSFLKTHNKMERCKAYIPYVDKMSDAVFGNFNWYFRESNCKAAVRIVPRRLASDRVKTRIGACQTLGKLGNKKHIRKVKVLAKRDPHFKLQTKRVGGKTFAVKVYPVRDACNAALTKLQLR